MKVGEVKARLDLKMQKNLGQSRDLSRTLETNAYIQGDLRLSPEVVKRTERKKRQFTTLEAEEVWQGAPLPASQRAKGINSSCRYTLH
ncbi:hypothetical protein FD724_06800 [Nostoc sp. C057]|uniref:hypothetical protein n=1 Tax=Nostoc sp. C057 TaxID=2576903 RepID=UPI0015C3A453|nr:hypothetical protein [Nostoc sp. C057]QLE47847.1 hypothetical protein FD724_06800 [Nostoc sp. C057]